VLGDPPTADTITGFAGSRSPAGANSSYFGRPAAAEARKELGEGRSFEPRWGEAEYVGGNGHGREELRLLGLWESWFWAPQVLF